MLELKETIGLEYQEFYENELYLRSRTQQFITGRKVVKQRIAAENLYRALQNASEKTKEEIDKHIDEINEMGIAQITVEHYEKYQLYKCSEEKITKILKRLKKRKQLKTSIRKKFIEIDKGNMSYEDVEESCQKLRGIIIRLMPEYFAKKLADKALRYKPELASDPDALREVVIDMEFTKFLLNFTYAEYVAFDFAGKSIPEKREFVNDIERLKLLRKVNDVSKFEILDDKYQAYEHLKPYFGREMIYIQSKEEFETFKAFCIGKDKIVVKPFFESLGRGIRAIDVPEEDALYDFYMELCNIYKIFVVEDLIEAHEAIKKLNPDAVNTVRMVTYFDGEKTIVHHPFMKVGKAGSFVDNGGQGGILVAVDPKTGMLTTDGCDEDGVTYEYHPDTNTKFKGYQLPNWDDALKLADELSSLVPGICYIGWDFALNKDGKWIIVEGNARTQFFGQQCTTKVGVKKELFATLNQPLF